MALSATSGLPDIPLVVGVTSHRNIAASELEPIRQRVRDFFAQLKHDFPELPLVVLSALAEGGDQLVAEEALAAGARLIAPLPMPLQSYAGDFTDAASRAAFSALCQRAEVLQLPRPGRGSARATLVASRRDCRDQFQRIRARQLHAEAGHRTGLDPQRHARCQHAGCR